MAITVVCLAQPAPSPPVTHAHVHAVAPSTNRYGSRHLAIVRRLILVPTHR